MKYIRTFKASGELITIVAGVEGEGEGEFIFIPVAAVLSRAALLGCTPEDALAAMLVGDETVDWSGLYADLGADGDTPARAEARASLGVGDGRGLDVAPVVQLQEGRVEAIADVLEVAPETVTDMTAEDVALAVQAGDIRGKLERALEGAPGAAAAVEAVVEQARAS